MKTMNISAGSPSDWPVSESDFTGSGGLKIHTRTWVPPVLPRAIVIIVHGLAEHSGRYHRLLNVLLPAGCVVAALDLPGHGKSEGARLFIQSFSDYLIDLEMFIDLNQKSYPGLKTFIFGHSLGGLIAVAYAMDNPEHIAGLILSAPLLKPGVGITTTQVKLSRFLASAAPRMGVGALDASGISRDPAVVAAYLADPLVAHGKVPARTGHEILQAMAELPARLPDFRLPFVIMQGVEDRLANPEGSRMMFETAGSKDKILTLYEGLFHEVINDLGNEPVLADIDAWLSARI